ncbi:MAG: aminotransferase class I/II-fold pyridoxal phosphate-dependent enzyme [Actinomycetota bacterium]|nr:aminotransferase class I/II-fold pyridoxal phosphate-dependent enzyme [Actinomycetota bacterium]
MSATLAIDEETERRRRAGRPVLPLGFGEAGLPVHESLQRALAEHAGCGSYGPVAGVPELRAAAAGYWDRRGLSTDPERVIAGPGSKPLLLALMITLGGPVALPRPSWVSYSAQAALIGRESVYVATLPEQGGVPDPERLDALAATARGDGRPLAAVVLTLPDNPTGTLAAESTVRAVCEVAERHDLVVISDEIYRDLVHDEQTSYLSPSDVIPHRTVVTSGLSKSLALGGWRIGVARLPDGPRGAALSAEVVSIASEIWSVPPVPVQRAAAWAFTEPDCLRERVRLSRRLHGRVARAVATEFRGAGADVPEPHGGFYLYPDLGRHRDRLRRVHGVDDGPGLATAMLDGPGIATLPGSAFGDATSALRLRVATSRLYGPTPEQQEDALTADRPLALPWINAQLTELRNGLDQLAGF